MNAEVVSSLLLLQSINQRIRTQAIALLLLPAMHCRFQQSLSCMQPGLLPGGGFLEFLAWLPGAPMLDGMTMT